MISCDTNVMFAACDVDNPRNSRASAFVEEHRRDQSFVLAEQVLMELYGLLRNPVISRPPLDAAEATSLVEHFRANPWWRIVDVPGEHRIMDRVWRIAGESGFAYRRIFDARLAVTLQHHGVTEFATCNTRDFAGYGFARVWDPLG